MGGGAVTAPEGSTRFGKYDLLAHLATGGMAEIFLARIRGAEGFQKLVVVKRLLAKLAEKTEYVEMFLDEARINARLSHSNVVQVLELGRVDGQYFMSMEYVSGLSLAMIGKLATQRLGAVPQEVAAGTLAQACAGLHYAHERKLPDGTPLGIIHRDISPQNLLLTTEGVVKVVDFGIAKAEGRATSTRAGVIKGKFAYMSPEQCSGEKLDRRSDVFALGIVLFELCTSRRLFKRESTYSTYAAIAACDVPDPITVNPQIPEPLAAVIRRALQRRREDRFQTAEEMQEGLEQAMARAGLRGGSTQLSAFLERTFGKELEAQRGLLARAMARGDLVEASADEAGAMTEGDGDEPTSVWTEAELEDVAAAGEDAVAVDVEPDEEDEVDPLELAETPAPKPQLFDEPPTTLESPRAFAGVTAPEVPAAKASTPPSKASPPAVAPAPPPIVVAPVPIPQLPTVVSGSDRARRPSRRDEPPFPWFLFIAVALVVATVVGSVIVYVARR